MSFERNKPQLQYVEIGIIIVHNHPSGQLKPSKDDLAITQQLVASGKIIDIPVVDHIIVANKNFLSMREDGYM